jgi:polysaccharide biosynthesis/export protein
MKIIKRLLTVAVALMLWGCVTDNIDIGSQLVKKIKVSEKDRQEIENILQKLHTVEVEAYKIVPGDRFDFYVYDNEDLTAENVVVMPDGTFSIGLVGVVTISGLTVREAVDMIDKKLGKYIILPKTALVPVNIKSPSFTIIGNVTNPGIYPLKSKYRITDAVALAQGLSVMDRNGDIVETADLEHAFIARDRQILPVNFVESVKKGNHLHNIPLKDGDYIYIPSITNREVFVIGEVAMPGRIRYDRNLSIVQALAYSKGRRESASSYSIVVRGNLNKPEVFEIDVDDIVNGKAVDFALEPNDIVFVPKGYVAGYNSIIEQIMPTLELLNLMAGPFGNSTISLQAGNSNR